MEPAAGAIRVDRNMHAPMLHSTGNHQSFQWRYPTCKSRKDPDSGNSLE
jgi:hypothetical protein